MRILVLNKLYWPEQRGGAEVSVRNLVRSFASAGHEVAVVCLSELPRIEQLDGATIFRLPIRNIYWPYSERKPGIAARLIWHLVDTYNPVAKADVGRIIDRFRPNVVLTNNLAGFSVSAWDAAHSRGIPIVHVSRDYYLIHPNSTLYKNGSNQSPRDLHIRLTGITKRFASRKVSGYVGISKYIYNLHLQLGYFSSVVFSKTIYNSVECQEPLPAKQRKLSNSGVTVLGYLGRIDSTKGIEVLLRAVGQLDDEVELAIAGRGDNSYMDELQRSSPNNVRWIGHTSPSHLFNTIDILVVPSLWQEPLGRVVLEAYSYGIPVVAARSGGIPEIIDEGVTGFTYDGNSSESLLKAIRLASKMDLELARERCLQKAKIFSNDSVAAAYLTLFSDLLNSPH